MNTTKKGDSLEKKVLELFTAEISNGRFFAQKEFCRIYTKKGYYSKDREKQIIFDVSIEIFLPGQDSYSVLVLIECKNLNHKVPVDDVEEFFQKTQQISGANIKGIVVSNNAFQESAFKFSRSKGIGLLRYYDRNNLNWILTRSPSSLVSSNYATCEWLNAYKGLTSESFESNYFDCYGYVEEQYTNSLGLFISTLIKYGADKDLNESLSSIEKIDGGISWLVKFKEESEIESLCESICSRIGYNFGEVSLGDICQWLQDERGLKVILQSSLGKGVLGQITFDPLEIHIDNKNSESSVRARFTLAHELGHFLLGHAQYMSGERCLESDVDLDNPPDIGVRDIMRMEWQANQFASCLLLPKKEFIQTFLSVAAENGLSNKGFGILYLDQQKCNLDAYYKTTTALMAIYNVSRTVVKIRLKKLGLLNEAVGNQPKNILNFMSTVR